MNCLKEAIFVSHCMETKGVFLIKFVCKITFLIKGLEWDIE